MAEKIVITKLEAARRQLETAIILWFHDGDPVSIHTLTAAAHRVVLDLLEHQGKAAIPFDMKYIQTGKEKEFKRLMRAAETFFKHAKDDPTDSHAFNPESTEFYLLGAVDGYRQLIHENVPLLSLFFSYVALTRPGILSEPIFPESSQMLYVQQLIKGPRAKFFNELLPSFVRASVGAVPKF